MSRSRARAKPPTHVVPPREMVQARPDRRRLIYAGFDFGLAALQSVVAIVSPSRHVSGQFLLWAIAVAFVVAGLASLVARPVAWRFACGALAVLLGVEMVLLVVLVASASYLAGVFGAFGQAAAGTALMAAGLSIQTIALVPVLQLKYFMTRAGRRAFGVATS